MAKGITMTLHEVYEEMKEAGIRCSMKVISDGIATGAYSFGRVVNTGETGRRTLQIFRVDFENWIRSKMPQDTVTYTPPIQLRQSG